MALNQHEPIYFTPAPIRGRYLTGLWKGGGDAPEAPDPVATANAQGAANLKAGQETTALTRADQITPYGKLTWKQGGSGSTFDQKAFDSALTQYQADMDAWNAKRSSAMKGGSASGSSGNPFDYVTSQGGYSGGNGQDMEEWEKANARPTMASREQFQTNYDPLKWTSTIELDPRMQALLDQDLATQQGIAQQGQNAIGRMDAALNKDPMTGLPAAGSAAAASKAALGQFTSPAADLARSQALAAQGGKLAGSQLDRLQNLYGQEFNYDGAPAMPEANEAARKAVEDALYGRATSRLDPQYSQTQSDLDSRLAAQGITQGSQAWQRENQNLGMSRNDAYQNARDSAVANSTTEMQKLFNMGMASRQQGVNEANTLRTLPSQEAQIAAQLNSGLGADNRGYYGVEQGQQTAAGNLAAQQFAMQNAERATALNEQNAQRDRVLNELNAIRTGSQVQSPNFQNTPGGTVGAAPIAQSMYNSYQGDVGNYNAQVGQQNSMLGGLASIGGSILGGPIGGAIGGLFG